MEMIREAGIIEDWIADGEARGEARGEVRGAARGKEEEARNLLLRLGTKRFGEPGKSVRARIEAISQIEALEQLVERTVDVEAWQDLLD